MAKPRRGGGRPPRAPRGQKKDEAPFRADDVYEAEENDMEERHEKSGRYDVSPGWGVGAPVVLRQRDRTPTRAAAPPCGTACAAAAARLPPPAADLRLAPSSQMQQVDNYEYEMPSDFEDEDIDDEMAFTGAPQAFACVFAARPPPRRRRRALFCVPALQRQRPPLQHADPPLHGMPALSNGCRGGQEDVWAPV